MPDPNERRQILEHLHTLAVEDVVKLWRSVSGMDLESVAFRALIVEAYPEIAAQWASVASELAVAWYDESGPGLEYRAVPAAPAPTPQLVSSAQWALGATGEAALDRFAGSLQRVVWAGARDTIVQNAESEQGSRWARYASATACAFCRVMATRGGVYASKEAAETVVGRGKEMSLSERRARARGESRISGRFIAGGVRTRREDGRKLGDKYHDRCRCIAVEVRPGGSYEPPSYVERWEKQYIDATRATTGQGDAIDLNAVLAHMRSASSGH